MSDANDGERKVSSLRDLPRAIQPPRDLWAAIEARIDAEKASGDSPDVPSVRSRRARPTPARWLAAAAAIGALAVGFWIGRNVSPVPGPQTARIDLRHSQPIQIPPPALPASEVQAAYLSDPKFRQERATLVKSLEQKLASLPPDSREKVISSLATIQKSKQDLEAALGKDPTNALLQELLVNTYQDEMRVLTTVHEASDTGKGI
jgi:hypothetical protein